MPTRDLFPRALRHLQPLVARVGVKVQTYIGPTNQVPLPILVHAEDRQGEVDFVQLVRGHVEGEGLVEARAHLIGLCGCLGLFHWPAVVHQGHLHETL